MMFAQWNPHLVYADVTGLLAKMVLTRLFPGFDITAYWGAKADCCR